MMRFQSALMHSLIGARITGTRDTGHLKQPAIQCWLLILHYTHSTAKHRARASAFSPMQPQLQRRLPAARAVAPIRPAVVLLPTPSSLKACRHHAPLMEAGPFSETPVRSFVKAAGWRFTAGVVTACTSTIDLIRVAAGGAQPLELGMYGSFNKNAESPSPEELTSQLEVNAAVAAVEMEANAVAVKAAATEAAGVAPEARLVTVGAPEEQAAAATACTTRCGTRRLGRARV